MWNRTVHQKNRLTLFAKISASRVVCKAWSHYWAGGIILELISPVPPDSIQTVILVS